MRFPGGSGWIALPPDRRLARSGITAWSASRPRAVVAQRVALLLSAALGPRALGAAREIACPLGTATWADLEQQWTDRLGSFDGIVPLLRRQPDRDGFALLLHRQGRRSAFVKLRQGTGTEPSVLRAAAQVAPGSFRAPALLVEGTSGPWTWFATEPLPAGAHRVGRPALDVVTAEVSLVVESALPRPAGTPSHWRGAHGDLTPWNLRRTAAGFVVFDWEDVRWAPPRTDEVLYLAAAAASRGGVRVRRRPGAEEAAEHLLQRELTTPVSAGDEAYRNLLALALAALT